MAVQDYIEDLYSAISEAETGHLTGDDKWIRTQAEGTGSSAFGPAQITKAALTSPYYKDIGFDKDTHEWIQNKYLPQLDLFLQYGGEDMIPGMEKYDYGGAGDFTADDRENYQNMAKQLMQHQFKIVKGNINKFIQSWRGAAEQEDPRYYDVVRNKYLTNQVVKEQGSEAF